MDDVEHDPGQSENISVNPLLAGYRQYIAILSIALTGFGVFFISIALKGVVYNILTQVDYTIYAQFLSIRERISESRLPEYGNILIIGIDNRTLKKFGAYHPADYRRRHIELLSQILKAEPLAVVYDILFADPHPDPSVDSRLAAEMAAGPVYSVFFASDEDRSNGMFQPYSIGRPSETNQRLISEAGFEPMSPSILSAVKGIGLANAYPDFDGLLRKMPIVFNVQQHLYPTIALEVFRNLKKLSGEQIQIVPGAVKAGDMSIPIDEDSRAYLNMERMHEIREISFYDAWAGRIPPKFFDQKIIFIAATATGLGDNKLVPLYGYVPGVKVHANLLLNMLHQEFIREVSGNAYYLALFGISLFYTFLFYTRRELSILKRLLGWFSNIALLTRFFEWFAKIPCIRKTCAAFQAFRDRRYGLRLIFLIFSETRKRLEPIVAQFVLLYLALFAAFYFFHLFIRPTALMVQLLIAYLIVSEFKQIDFSQIKNLEETPHEPQT